MSGLQPKLEMMQIKEMTPEQLHSLISNAVDQTLDEYFGDPDEGLEMQESFEQSLQKIQHRRQTKKATISLSEVCKKYELES
jgi:hypothetical protein